MNGPNPTLPHPVPQFTRICYIRNTVTNPNIVVGDYTYFDDPEDARNFERNVLYHFPFVGDRLVIGKFCAIAQGVRFLMNGANHSLRGMSTYPFFVFGNGWEAATPPADAFPYKGDTVVGNDVWLGYQAVVLPGVKIGDGAIIGACSVVTRDVPPYAIVGGNPARLLRMRFPPDTIEALQRIAWWDWPVEKITRHLAAITGADIHALESASTQP